MTRPFDEKKYQSLLDGLEITELNLSEVLKDNTFLRIDSDYFKKEHLQLLKGSKETRPLGQFVKDGYRVVYENTEIIDFSIGETLNYPIFLQATDIQTPFINTESLFYVEESDWVRYPKGRVKRGEILIEVKGKAEKVAFVPEDFPEKVLISGSIYKLTPKQTINKYFLLNYLLSKYGQSFKERAKTNLLVSFVSKEDLYNIPVPILSDPFQKQIEKLTLKSFQHREQSKQIYAEAENLLLDELGLRDFAPTDETVAVASFGESFLASGRIDAEYFHPEKRRMIERLNGFAGKSVRHYAAPITELVDAAKAEKPAAPVRNFDLTDALEIFLDEKETMPTGELGSTKKRFKPGDVVVSRLRSYLKEIAIVDTPETVEAVGSSEFIVLRPNAEINAETLLVYLRSLPVQQILKWCQSGSQHPRFAEEDLFSIRLPDCVLALRETFKIAVRRSIAEHRRSKKLLEIAKRAVETAIEKSEDAAMNYIDDELKTI